MPLNGDDGAPAVHVDLVHAASMRVAVAGVRLGLFDTLAAGPLAPAELATRTGTDERALRLLTTPLVTFGYLRQDGDTVANTPASDPWLLSGRGFTDGLLFWHEVLGELWSDVEETVRTGRPAVDFYPWLERRPTLRARFQAMLARSADSLADGVCDLLGAPGARLLDVGGGHARYSVAFCRRSPHSTATVIDHPGALDHAFVDATGLGERIGLAPGDFTADDLGSGYDLALLFNILHGFGADTNRRLLASVARALAPGGRVAIMESVAGAGPRPGPVAAAFVQIQSLNLFHGQGGAVHRSSAIESWLTAAGFGDPTVTAVPGSTTHSLIVATRNP